MDRRKSFICCMILIAVTIGTGRSMAEEIELPQPGKEFKFTFEKNPFVLLVPSDYEDMNETPLMFYYHGQGGQPNVHYCKTITGAKGFIIVGMSYTKKFHEPMTAPKYTNYLKREMRRLRRLKKHLENEFKLRIDQDQLYVCGISMGGWHTNDLFELRPRPWAGALIVAAGRSPTTAMSAVESKFKKFDGKPVYIGVGETDVNRKAAERARNYLRSKNAEVTFEIYEGLGHDVDFKSKVVRKWISDRRDMSKYKMIKKQMNNADLKEPDPNVSEPNMTDPNENEPNIPDVNHVDPNELER